MDDEARPDETEQEYDCASIMNLFLAPSDDASLQHCRSYYSVGDVWLVREHCRQRGILYLMFIDILCFADDTLSTYPTPKTPCT